jgi:hypothetical protein
MNKLDEENILSDSDEENILSNSDTENILSNSDTENILSNSDTENILSKNKEGPSSTDQSNKVEDEENNAAMKSMFTGLDAQKK